MQFLYVSLFLDMSSKKAKKGSKKSAEKKIDKNYLQCQWSINKEKNLVIEKKGNGFDRDGGTEVLPIKPGVGWQAKMKGEAEQGLAIFSLLDDKQIMLAFSKLKSRDDTNDKIKTALVRHPDKSLIENKRKIHGIVLSTSFFLFSI